MPEGEDDVAAVFPHDPGKADAVRRKAVEWILKLQEKGSKEMTGTKGETGS